jgi:hypothetical protein
LASLCVYILIYVIGTTCIPDEGPTSVLLRLASQNLIPSQPDFQMDILSSVVNHCYKEYNTNYVKFKQLHKSIENYEQMIKIHEEMKSNKEDLIFESNNESDESNVSRQFILLWAIHCHQ